MYWLGPVDFLRFPAMKLLLIVIGPKNNHQRQMQISQSQHFLLFRVWRYPDFFLVPGPVLFSGTNFILYRYRYHPKRSKIPRKPKCHTLLLFCVLFICISYFVHLCLGRKLPYFCKIVNISIFFLRVFAFPLIFGEYWSEWCKTKKYFI